MANIELLQETLDYIKAHPSEWYQEYWASKAPMCGTKFCFAGHAIQLAQPKGIKAKFYWMDSAENVSDPSQPHEGLLTANLVDVPDGTYEVAELASRYLGLTDDEADYLFEGDNTIARLEEYIDVLKDGGDLQAYVEDKLESSCQCSGCVDI